MVKAIISNNLTVIAKSADDVVDYLMNCSMRVPPSRERYMKEVARRYKMYFGEDMKYVDSITFLQSLAHKKQIKEVIVW